MTLSVSLGVYANCQCEFTLKYVDLQGFNLKEAGVHN